MKEHVIELAKQAGFDVVQATGLKQTVQPDIFAANVCITKEVKLLIKLVRNAALDELSDKLKQSGATLPAKQEHEGGNAVLAGVSIALVVIEEMKEPTP